MHLPRSSSEDESPSKQNRKFALKIKKFPPAKGKSRSSSPSSRAVEESYATSIERVILNCSKSEEDANDSVFSNGSASESVPDKSQKGKRTKNIPVKNKLSNGETPKTKAPKSPKKVSAKKHKVRSPRGMQSKKSRVSQTFEDGSAEADMPKIDSLFENSQAKSQKKLSASPQKSEKKRKLSGADSSDGQEFLNSSIEEQSAKKKRTFFPKRAPNLRKRKIIQEFSQSESTNEKKSPSKSILVVRDTPRAAKKLQQQKFLTHESGKDDPPKKKVKFESTMPVEMLDLSMDHSIETLTEWVRQKRIRPPYGQPYSVTGSWYIASGYLQDLASLLEKFVAQADSRFTSFANCWREMLFSQIYRGRQSFKELLEFSEEVVVLTKKFLEGVHCEKRRIGALYTLYSLYYKHPVRHNFFLRFTLSQYQDLVALVKRQPHHSNPDPARILLKLHADCAIHQTAADNELCIGLHTSYNSSNVSVEYGFFRLAQSSNVPRALPDLSMDDKLMKEYHRVKTAAATAAAANPADVKDDTSVTTTGPDRALSLFNSSCCEEVKKELLQLEDFTLTLLSFKGQHAVHARPPLHSDPMLAVGVKRYAIKRRATSIAAAEARAKLMEKRQEEGESGASPSDEDLDLSATEQLINSAPKSTLYVGKLEIGAKEKAEGGEGALEKIPPSKYGYKGRWQPALGQSFVKRGRGRKPIYLNTQDKSLLAMPIEAAKITLNARKRRDMMMKKLAETKEINLTLDIKGIVPTLREESLEEQVKPQNGVTSESCPGISAEEEGLSSETELYNLGETVGPLDNGDISETDYATWSMISRRDNSLLEMRLQMMVNGKWESKSIKANMSVARFEAIKSDPAQLSKLHDKFLTMILPKLRLSHGRDVVVKNLRIIKAQLCHPDPMKPQDFITGNQPFVKCGKCNIKLRMKLMEKFQQKTPVKPKVEQVSEVSRAHAKLLPIVVGGKPKYIQCDGDENSESTLAASPCNLQVSGVLRSHNCNWNKAKKIGKEFKTFKYKLNAITSNMRKLKPINEECPTKAHLKIQRYKKSENDLRPNRSAGPRDTPYTLVSFRKSKPDPNQICTSMSSKRSKGKSVTFTDEPDQPNGDSSQNEKQASPVKEGKTKSEPKNEVESVALTSSCQDNRTVRRTKRTKRISRLKAVSPTKPQAPSTVVSSPEVKFSVTRGSGEQDTLEGSGAITYRARIPWHSTVVPDVDSVTESGILEPSESTENWRDSLLLSPDSEMSLAKEHKEYETFVPHSKSSDDIPVSESHFLTISDIQNDWEIEPEEIEKKLDTKPDVWKDGNDEGNFVTVGIEEVARVKIRSLAVENDNAHDWNDDTYHDNDDEDDHDSIIDPGTECDIVTNEDLQPPATVSTESQLLNQLKENGVSVLAVQGSAQGSDSLSVQSIDNVSAGASSLTTSSSSEINVDNSETPSSFPVEVPPLVAFNLPEVSHPLPMYNSSLPVIIPPTPLTGLPLQSTYYAPPSQSYIRAHTQDGVRVILPPNIYFSIVDSACSDMNDINVGFNNSSESMVFRSQPIIHSAVPANTIPYVSNNPTDDAYEPNANYEQYTQSVVAPVAPLTTTDDSAATNIVDYSADVSYASDDSMAQTPGLTTTVARLSQQQNLMSSLDLQPIPSVSCDNSLEPSSSLRSSPRKGALLPDTTGSYSPLHATPAEVSSTRDGAKPVDAPVSTMAISPLKNLRIVNSTTTFTGVVSTTSTSGKRNEVSRTSSSDVIASNEKQNNGDKISGDASLDVVSNNGNTPDESNSLTRSPQLARPTSSNCTTPIVQKRQVNLPQTPQTNRKSVCSFLVTNKFKNLGVAIGAAGSASGKPTVVKKARVSFLRKGSLTKPSPTPPRTQ